MATKSDIRKKLLKERDMLDAGAVSEKSAAIMERLCSLKEYRRAKIIMAYMSIGNEVCTRDFIKRCMLEGKTVAIPKVEKGMAGGRGNLAAYALKECGKDLVAGFKGIPEPDTAVLSRIDPKDMDLAVVPGIAFDFRRYRIGYGGGYYDMFLPGLRPDCLKAGLAYEMQLVAEIPVSPHDVPVDLVITECRLI